MNLDAVTTAIGQVGLTLIVIAIVVALLEGLLYLLLVRLIKTKYAIPIMLVAPAALGLALLIGWPLLWELNVSFTKMSLRNFRDPGFLGLSNGLFVGLENYVQVFTSPSSADGLLAALRPTCCGRRSTSSSTFLGMGLAPSSTARCGEGDYRASSPCRGPSPRIIALLIWRTEYNYEFGAANQLLGLVGLGPSRGSPTRSGTSRRWSSRTSAGRPVHDGVIILGGLQSIRPTSTRRRRSTARAAARRSAGFTLPLLRTVLTPAIILGTVWTFNNINVPYFINQNELETSDTW